MYSNGFYPLVSKSTRITSHSATLIDNIFSNDPDNHKFSDILWSDISDHLPVFQITNYCSLMPKTKSSVYHKRLITSHITLKIFVPIFVLSIGFSHNLPLQMHCTILLWTVFIQSMRHHFLLRLSLSKKIQKPNLGLPQGSKSPVARSMLSINNIVIILHQLTRL